MAGHSSGFFIACSAVNYSLEHLKEEDRKRKMADYSQAAKDIIAGVGGESNVASMVHCATRLRFVLKDTSVAKTESVKALDSVVAVAQAGGQYQVVIGNDVAEVYDAIGAIAPRLIGTGNDAADSGAPRGSLFDRFVRMISSIFTPFLWALAATGLIKAFLVLAVTLNWIDPTTTTYTILYAIGDATINFMPIALAFTAARYFKASEFVSYAIAATLVYPSIILLNTNSATVPVTFFGIPVVMMSYVSSVIPIIVAVWVQSHFERWLNSWIPKTLKNFVTPMIVLVVLIPAVLLVIGPATTYLSQGLANGIQWLWDLAPWIGGAIMGGLWQVFVLFGLHWGFVPIMQIQYTTLGYISMVAPLFAAVLAQAAAAAGVWVRARSAKRKQLAAPAAISGFLAGVTEPAIYGINLPLKRPFIYGIIGGAVGGAIAAAGGAATTAFVLPSALSIPAALGHDGFGLFLVGTAAAIIISFTLTVTLGFTEDDLAASVDVVSPFDGKIVPLSQVNDPAFSTGSLGDGIAVIPADGIVQSPVDAEVVAVFPTGHAIGLRTSEGLEVLIHVGINTVQLGGEHFTNKVEKGQKVAKGDVLSEFDRDAILAAGYDLTSPIIVTNRAEFPTVGSFADGAVTAGSTVFAASKAAPSAKKVKAGAR